MADVTRILAKIQTGDRQASEQLLPLVYAELRKLAAERMAQEKPGQTLQATALVHDAYIRLVDGNASQSWDSRGHFFAAAAEAMRRILVDNALRKQRPKHGGNLKRLDVNDVQVDVNTSSDQQIVALDAALDDLAEHDGIAARIVKLKYFAGLTVPQIAEVLGLSARTVDRRWAYARAWLHQELLD